MTHHRRPLSAAQKAERIRLSKRSHIRKKRAEKREAPPPSFIGPKNLHMNSLDAPSLTPEQKAARTRMQNRLSQQRRRDKQKLLSPTFRLIVPEDMSRFKSWFSLHAGDFEYVLHLAPWEMYSTKLGCIYKHGRHVLDETGRHGPQRPPRPEDYEVDDKHWIEISGSEVQFLDHDNDLLHAVRPGSPILELLSKSQLFDNLPYRKGILDVNFSIIANGLLCVGAGDTTRSPHSYRVSFGWNEFCTPTSFGKVDRLLKSNAKAFKMEIGKIAELLCACMLVMQVASSNQIIWTNAARDAIFAAKLRNRLGLQKNSPMRAEMVVASLMPLTKFRPKNKEHTDPKNPHQTGYNRNGTFSAVVAGEDGHLYLLQVLVASRRYAQTCGKMGLS